MDGVSCYSFVTQTHEGIEEIQGMIFACIRTSNHIQQLTKLIFIIFLFATAPHVVGQTMFGGNAQHTGIFNAPAQNLNVIKWQRDIDLHATSTAHYGSPVVSANNTVFVPVKTATDGFRIDVFDGADGALKYTLDTDYLVPSHGWFPPYNICIVGTRLYYAGAGGTMLHVDNIDSNSPTTPVREVFYTSLGTYTANKAAFDSTVFINTPITADSAGNIFFGFRVQNVAPAPLNTQQSGLARLTAGGSGSFVLAGNAANDPLIDRDSHSAGPALSNDETSVYFPVKASSNTAYSYLLELNSTTLATKHSVFLRDPRNGLGARIFDDSTSTPMVAPDGDVYFGVFGNTGNGSRGFLLRFSGDLSVTKAPGAFGWDYTPGIVPASMVPSYTGASSYLIFCKYNDYASLDGSGVNRVAILDPNETQLDSHVTAPGLVEMREVLTLIGPTPDNAGPSFPLAVQEFCINAPAVNPATNSVFFDSEDGHLYRWNLVTNSIDQAVPLSPGVLQPYVPTVIGPDGTVYTLNGGNVFAIGEKPGVSVTISSSAPDVRRVIVGDSITFTATVSRGVQPPTGTVTFTAVTFNGLTAVGTTLASNVPIDANGRASVTTSSLAAGGNNFGNHFITASYSGDATHQPSSAKLVQKVHANQSVTTLSTSKPVASVGEAVTFTAVVSGLPNGSGTPTGMVRFLDGTTTIGQVPLTSGQATLVKSNLSFGVHTIRAVYASDTFFAESIGTSSQVIGPGITIPVGQVSVFENGSRVDVQVALLGAFTTPVTVDYTTVDDAGSNGCSVTNGNASARCDYLKTTGTLTFNPGETLKLITVPIVDDSFAEGNETFALTITNVVGANPIAPVRATITITDNDAVNGTNPTSQTEFFVRQHYLDFLNREPDTSGFNHWVNEINSCGANAQCIEVKRINVSAAFFLSIEFQETGYLVYRIYKSAFGNLTGLPVPIAFNEFMLDTQQIQKGVQVNVGDWQTQLEANKQAYALAFVQRNDFLTAFPLNMSAQQFVDKLNANAGGVLTPAEVATQVAVLGATPGDATKRSQVLRAVAEDVDLKAAEFNRAFVLMQYFGYLRRNPNDLPDTSFEGFEFWLGKLNDFNGNYIAAEMVKAFITSDEYIHRFGP
jgi:hypothetical protein